jgi:hypothetical protein
MLATALERWRLTRPGPDDLREGRRDLQSRAHLETRAPTPDCIDELAIADVVDGALTGSRRAEVMSHLASCARCRASVRATAALVADEAVARAIPGRRRQTRVWASIGVAAAAAAAIVIIIVPGNRGITLREPAVTNAIAPVTLSPRGSVVAVERLVWSKVPGAERYRLRLHRLDGTVVWSVETEDSLVVLPPTVRLAPREAYYWRVEALTEWRRWVESEMTQFRVEPRQP